VSVAALALAAAVLVSPPNVRGRLRLAPPRRSRRARLIGAVLVAGSAALLAATVAPVTVLLAAAIVVATVALRRHRRRARLRSAGEAEALQSALDVLVSELRAGAHPVAAFDAAASETDGAVTDALRAVAARARLGADVTAGLQAVARTSRSPGHWTRIAVCWQLAETHGLAIATLMSTAQRDITERQRFASRVDAGMAGARATAGVLAVLPVLGLGLGQLIGADPVRFLLSGGFGGWLLTIGIGLSCAGLLWSDRITTGVVP
jgi:tight adherence protein B